MEQKKAFHVVVAERLIEQLKAGTAPWLTPWNFGEPNSYLPMNPTTGKRYRGINAIHLLAAGRSDMRWLTYRQAQSVGAQVRKGEKSTAIQFWKFTEERDKLDERGRPVLDAEGRKVKQTIKLERPRVFFATVFNAEQIDGLPLLKIRPRPEQQWDAIERAERILQASGAKITHSAGDRAFYRLWTDSITLPERGQFESADRYYATALHELGHWTGHSLRLDRDMLHPFGSEGYAKEELRAEISSMIMGDELGIGHDPGQHVAYVDAWIKVLKDDPLEIFRAAADAEKIYDYVLAFEQKQVQEQPQVQDVQEPDSATLGVAAPSFAQQQNQQERGLDMQPTDQIEVWVLRHIEHDTLGQALEGAGLERIDQVLDLLYSTRRLETQSELMARGIDIEPLEEKIFEAIDYITEKRRPIAEIADAFVKLKMGDDSSSLALDAATDDFLGFKLPHDWSGEVAIVDENIDGIKLYAYKQGAQKGEDEPVYLTSAGSLKDADELAGLLALISANIEVNSQAEQHAKVAGMAQGKKKQNVGDRSVKKQDALQRQYINVPYKEKEEVKELGARWDRQQRSWYVPTGIDVALFAKWAQGDNAAAIAANTRTEGRIYLAVPYAERFDAKAAGACWDKIAKSWYAGPVADMAKLERWNPDNMANQQLPAMTPREEFAEAMRSAGLFTGSNDKGDHPIMDGRRHRVPVEGGKKGALDGFYVGHLDGQPAGRIINNKTGKDITWKSKGYVLSDQEKAILRVKASGKLARRAAEQDSLQEAAARRVALQVADLVPVVRPTAYLQAKGIKPQPGVFTDHEGQKTYLPAFDADGKQWTMQYIQEDGTKRFAKECKKEGCFHPVGGMEALAAAPALVISEGYATAASNAEALGFATVAAFDAGNLPHVARALHKKYPHKPIIIAGDDDKVQQSQHGRNPGRTKAEEAARAVGGAAIFPVFAAGEWDKNPHELSDFNDLAVKSVLGREGLKRQVGAAVKKAIETNALKEQRLDHGRKVAQSRSRMSRVAL